MFVLNTKILGFGLMISPVQLQTIPKYKGKVQTYTKTKGIVSYAFLLVDALLLLAINVHQIGVPAVPDTVVDLLAFGPSYFSL